MKKLFLACAVITLCAGLCTTTTANPTLSLAGSESTSTTTVKESDDSEFFLKEWLYWLLDDIFGWDQGGGRKRYNSVTSNLNPNPGNDSGDPDYGDWDPDYGDWDPDPGNDGWGSDPDGGGSGSNPGDGGGSGSNPGDNGGGTDPDGTGWDNDLPSGWDNDLPSGWDRDIPPTQTIPAPGALLLGGIGSGLVTWLRRRRYL